MRSDASCKDIAVIDGQGVNIANQADLIREVILRAKIGQGFTVATLNLDHLVKRRQNAAFREAYARMTLVTVDGAPVIALGKGQAPQLERAQSPPPGFAQQAQSCHGISKR